MNLDQVCYIDPSDDRTTLRFATAQADTYMSIIVKELAHEIIGVRVAESLR